MTFSEDALESLPDRLEPRRATTIFLWTIAGFFALFIIWAALTKIDRTVRGAGRVIADSQLQVVSNLEGGVLKQISVKTGQRVAAGQILVQLDPVATGSDLGSGEASVIALSLKAARLTAEVLGTEPRYPYLSDGRAAQLVQIERALHRERMAELASLDAAGAARVSASAGGIGEADAVLAARQSAARSSSVQLATTRELVEKGLEPRMALEQSEGTAEVDTAQAAAARSAAGRARATVAEARATALQARTDWRGKAAEELTKVRAELAAREVLIPQLQARLDRTTVRAPVAGRINRVLVNTVGAAISPGSPIAEIVPTEDSLIVEAKIRPEDIGRVRIGQRARVNISAYDASVFGGLEGTVLTISPDALTDERTGESFYIVRVETKHTSIRDSTGHAMPIGAGMTADVSLLGEKRSILAYLLTPITRLSETAFRE